MTKKFLPGKFELVGGHVDFGEQPEDALKREVWEELGQEIIVDELISAFSYINEIKGSHSFELVYLARFVSPEADIELNPEDHLEYKWAGRQQCLELRDKDDAELPSILKGFDRLEQLSKLGQLPGQKEETRYV
jgi:8-oxo-dGTP diphosphatase